MVLAAMLAIGPAGWLPESFYAWLASAESLGPVVLLAGAGLIAVGTWLFQLDAFRISASDTLLPTAKGAALTAVVTYALVGGMADVEAWGLVALLAIGVHWIVVWLCTIFDVG